MQNPFTCDNCIFNPSQFHDLGTRVGFCLKHAVILRNASHTTCRFHTRKDLPSFLGEEGKIEHAEQFKDTSGVVHYWNKYKEDMHPYSEKHAWLTRTFDPNLHDVAIYHRTGKKWTFLQALCGSRSPVKSIMHSCMVRRYIFKCGPERDNYRLILALSSSLAEPVDLQYSDFRIAPTPEDLASLRECYGRDIILLRLYAIQEYGYLTKNEHVMWASDELNGAFLTSLREYLSAVAALIPLIQTWIVDSAKERGTFFQLDE